MIPIFTCGCRCLGHRNRPTTITITTTRPKPLKSLKPTTFRKLPPVKTTLPRAELFVRPSDMLNLKGSFDKPGYDDGGNALAIEDVADGLVILVVVVDDFVLGFNNIVPPPFTLTGPEM